MKTLLVPLLVAAMGLPTLSGCIVHTHRRACAYGYHWNGRYCVRNGYYRAYAPPPRTVIVRDYR